MIALGLAAAVLGGAKKRHWRPTRSERPGRPSTSAPSGMGKTKSLAFNGCPLCKGAKLNWPQCAAAESRTPVRCCELVEGQETACWPVCPPMFSKERFWMKRRLRPLTLAQWQRATHEEAEAECRAHNMRLCTARELVDGACCDTACPLDVAVVWTGDECAAGSASTVLAEHPRSRAFDRGSNSPNVTLCPKHQKPRRRPGAGQGADPELRGDGVKRGCGHGGRDLSRCVMKHGVPVNSAFTSRARGHRGSLLQLLPDWEVDTGFFVFRNLVDARSVVLDIGGWIGLTARSGSGSARDSGRHRAA